MIMAKSATIPTSVKINFLRPTDLFSKATES